MAGGVVLLCLVVGITDGDTLTALCDRATVKIRLAEIDAPEQRQPYGALSKQHLSMICFQKSAAVRPQTKDRNGRTVARVVCEGVDASSEQVQAGMAWVFDKYVTDRSLYAIQSSARVARRGLWSDESPIAPWDWRAHTRLGAPRLPPER